jgi:hypothetical protein
MTGLGMQSSGSIISLMRIYLNLEEDKIFLTQRSPVPRRENMLWKNLSPRRSRSQAPKCGGTRWDWIQAGRSGGPDRSGFKKGWKLRSENRMPIWSKIKVAAKNSHR